MSRWEDELRFARHLADVADAITLPAFRSELGVRIKDDGTPVTDADEAAERAIRDEIAEHYPDHVVLGEEEGSTGSGAARWIIDPIDGTKGYASGVPIWATLIALEVDGEVVCGVASAPALGERYAAASGRGATCNGVPIHVSEMSSIDGCRLTYTSYRSFQGTRYAAGFDRLVESSAWARGWGDFWGHMLVASGRADVMVEPQVSAWDLAALIAIVEEAGGSLTDLNGRRRIDGGSVLTTNGRLHAAALAVLEGA
jgi:histidinol-phosphatase